MPQLQLHLVLAQHQHQHQLQQHHLDAALQTMLLAPPPQVQLLQEAAKLLMRKPPSLHLEGMTAVVVLEHLLVLVGWQLLLLCHSGLHVEQSSVNLM